MPPKNGKPVATDKSSEQGEHSEQYMESNLRITRVSEISITTMKENLKAKIEEMQNGGEMDEETRAALLEC